MKKIKITLIKEGKVPTDNRVLLSPKQAAFINENYEGLEISIQESDLRCFGNHEYTDSSIEINNNLIDADILAGIKEVPIQELVENKTYLMFSHTAKFQPYNRELLKEILKKKITLIDYEYLVDEHGDRLIGFGKWAGVVGAHYAFKMLSNRFGRFDIPKAVEFDSYFQLKKLYTKTAFPEKRIVLTGSGRVAEGALEILRLSGYRELSPVEFLEYPKMQRVFTRLGSEDLYKRKDGGRFIKADFYNDYTAYQTRFNEFVSSTDVLINGMFWNNKMPRLFEEEEANKSDFKISIIADITCDFNGSVPITTFNTTTDNPIFGYDKSTFKTIEPYQEQTIDMMTIGNLPNELPKDASETFGDMFIANILPEFFQPESQILKRATIAKNGELTEIYRYLEDFVK